jgi:hypothetical protein
VLERLIWIDVDLIRGRFGEPQISQISQIETNRFSANQWREALRRFRSSFLPSCSNS